MTAAHASLDGYFLVVEPDECRQLLQDARVGRVSWASQSGEAQILPVAYGVAVDGRIGFRVSPRSVIAELATSTQVLFEVDDIDPATATGWSVIVRGRASLWEGDFPLRLASPWAPGDRSLALQIQPERYTGRSVSAD